MSESHQNQQVGQPALQSPLSTNSKRHSAANWKLDPSLLITQNSNYPDPKQLAKHKMTLRHRGIKCQSSIKDTKSPSSLSASKYETILPLNSTYLPKEEVRDNIKTCCANRRDKPESDIVDHCNRHPVSQNDKIFSITTYVALIVAFVTLFGFSCLYICNTGSSLVSAQYSNFAPNSNNNNNHHHHNSARSPGQHLLNRQGGGSRSLVNYPQQTAASLNRQDTSPDTLDDQTNDEGRKWSKKSSIDRYDSGEQIRPPLLRTPTTLAPLKSLPQQASVNEQHNLIEAASQDSYLSPDDREQLLRSQDNHYEGRGVDPSSSASSDGFTSDRDGYEKPATNRWSQPMQDVPEQPVAVGLKRNSLEFQSSRPEPSTATASGSSAADNDDGDYEEEAAEPASKRKPSLVPEMRRGVATGSAASYNHQRPSTSDARLAAAAARNRADKYNLAADEAAVANEEADPSDDYGGGSDDTHFSRKSQQQDRSPTGLNLAASHNQQLNRGLHPGGGYSSEAQRGTSESGGPSDEGQGFGPGPNEAYLAEKAEVGKDQDGDDSLYAPGEGSPGESNGLGNGEEAGEGRFDRRSMNPYQTNGGGSSGGGSNLKHSYGSDPINYGQAMRARANLVDAGDSENESEDGNDAGDESGSSFAPSLKTEVKSRPAPLNPPSSSNSHLSPRTSASALAPQAAAFSQSGSPITTVPSPMLGGGKANLPVNNQQSFHRQQVHNVKELQNRQANNVATTTSQPNVYQRASLNAPYNPQNNPSHAGKYFIN